MNLQETTCHICQSKRIGDLHRAGKEIYHFQRIKSFNTRRNPIQELENTGINLYHGDQIREDIYDFISPDFIYYKLIKCRPSTEHAVLVI